jgi:hypothetical protein
MKRSEGIGTVLFSIFFITLFFFPGAAFGAPLRKGVDLAGGVYLSINSRTDIGAPSPISPFFSVSLPLQQEGSRFSLVPSISLHKGWYRYDEAAGLTIPAELEQRDLTVVVPILEAAFRYDLIVRESFETGPQGGLALFLPVPLAIWQNEDTIGELISGLYGSGQFVMPMFGWHLMVLLNDTHPLLIGLKSLIPLHRLWDGEGLPFHDRLGVSLQVGYRIR